jgi:hypothetical protein
MMEIIDTFMVTAFVLFMIFMIRGFMLQSAEKNRDRLNK